ncbi:MAG: hypothetical protein C0507_07475 [Cyanobacteria bacterium PR.3.49]|nr:hypothetical protein [Cyanobacteria bacterium PR.3.49]
MIGMAGSVAIVVAGLTAAPLCAQGLPYESCHIKMGEQRAFVAELLSTLRFPHCAVRKWILFVPSAPTLPGQGGARSALGFEKLKSEVSTISDLRFGERQLLRGVVTDNNDPHQLTFKTNYQVTLSARQLVDGASSERVTPLTSEERQRYLAQSETLRFEDPIFQSWLDAKGLRRKQDSDLKFAWRAFRTIRGMYSYKYSAKQDRRIQKLCEDNSTDCGGLSWLFVGVLRANGIPARSLVGRWAESGDESGVSFGNAHVKSEFYAANVGWIPIELSGAVEHKERDSILYFGKDSGNFITFHVDPDFELDTLDFGKRAVRNLQSPAVWVAGSGNLKDSSETEAWSVKNIPAY